MYLENLLIFTSNDMSKHCSRDSEFGILFMRSPLKALITHDGIRYIPAVHGSRYGKLEFFSRKTGSTQERSPKKTQKLSVRELFPNQKLVKLCRWVSSFVLNVFWRCFLIISVNIVLHSFSEMYFYVVCNVCEKTNFFIKHQKFNISTNVNIKQIMT